MIYLITGVPGSGKSLYAVSTLLKKLLSEVVKAENGKEYKRRLCIDGIPNLLLPHELMAPRAEASLLESQSRERAEAPEGHGLWNWWTWAKPGDVMVCDEVQRHWRPRGMGTKPPEDIAKLEVHRHFGVDFVLITQNAMLLDQNVRRLVGRHLHVRRLFGTARALIYDWDGCQTDTTRTQGSTRSVWSYPKSAYKLYKSSELHTKQHQKIPLFLAFPLVVLALGAFAGPKAYQSMHGAMTGKGINQAVAAVPAGPAASRRVESAGTVQTAPPAVAASAPGVVKRLGLVASVPAVGCVTFAGRCECFGHDGRAMEVEPAACVEGTHRVGTLVPLSMEAGYGAAPHDDDGRGTRTSHGREGGEPDKMPSSEVAQPPAIAAPRATPPRAPSSAS